MKSVLSILLVVLVVAALLGLVWYGFHSGSPFNGITALIFASFALTVIAQSLTR